MTIGTWPTIAPRTSAVHVNVFQLCRLLLAWTSSGGLLNNQSIDAMLEFASGLAAGLYGQPVLAQYGVGDIVKDLVFNVVGASLVALWGTQLFQRPARALAGSVSGLLR
jgi:hypothetical protein